MLGKIIPWLFGNDLERKDDIARVQDWTMILKFDNRQEEMSVKPCSVENAFLLYSDCRKILGSNTER